MAVGGPPWSNGSAVRAGFATVSAVVAVLLAWLVARLDLPLLHAVAATPAMLQPARRKCRPRSAP